MTGCLLELVAKGVEDLYLIGNPQITLFISVYKRISNFSMYDHTFDLKGVDFSKEFRFQIDRLGDLLHKIYMVVDIPEIILERVKATFDYIFTLLSSHGVYWNFSPESKTSLVTLHNYNGGIATITSDKINTSIFHQNDSFITLSNGIITVGKSTLKVISGTLNLDSSIIDDFDSNFSLSQTILSSSVNVTNGNLKITTNSVFGDVFPITSGTITLNKQKIGSSYVYFISNVTLISEFTNTILKAINDKITNLIEVYNLYVNTQIITKHSDNIINNSTKFYDNLDPLNLNDVISNEVADIKQYLVSGRNVFMEIVQTILSKYCLEYNFNSSTVFLPKTQNTYLIEDSTNGLTREVQLYSENFKNTILPFGLLLGALQSYSYDTLVYNANFNYKYIVVIDDTGNLYKSIDNGESFQTINISSSVLKDNWISNDSNNHTVIDDLGYVYTSDNNALNWTSNNVSAFPLHKITSSNTGNIQMTIASTTLIGYVYMTTNHWTSFVTHSITLTSDDYIVDIATSSDGMYSTIVTRDGHVYIYDIDNDIWIAKNILTIDSLTTITSCALSYDGNIQTIVGSNGQVFLSTNQWSTYTIKYVTLDTTNLLNITTHVAIAENSTFQIISDSNGNVYVSSSTGASWSYAHNVSNYHITKIQIASTDGKDIILVDTNGDLYISSNFGIKWNTKINTPASTCVSCSIKLFTISDTVTRKIDMSNSIPLFEDSLSRPQLNNDIVQFKLYNSDDIRMLFYVTFLNNILRQKMVLTSNEIIPFNPIYSTKLKNSDIPLSSMNIDRLDPDNTSIDDCILFYHIIDSRTTNYTVYPYNIGSNTDVYFDNNIATNYSLYDKYNDIIGGTREDYKIVDSYKTYKSFMKDLMTNDTVNKTIKSKQQVDLLATTLRYNIDINNRYNINQVLNNITILANATRTNPNHYILTFYRQYTASIDTYVSTSGLSFVPVIDSESLNLADNFKKLLNTLIEVTVPSGVAITNFFGDYINIQFKNFTTSCQNLLKSTNYEDYLSDYNLWERAMPTSGSSMLAAYNFVNTVYTNFPTIPATVFGKISLMNFIPLLVAKDIPVMMYNVFSQYGKQMMIDLGIDSDNSQTNYDDFLSIIDFRDNDLFDRDSPLPSSIDASITETKLEIYTRLVLSLFLTSFDSGATQRIDNIGHFQQLQFEKAGGQNVLLAFTIRPDTFFCKYSIRNDDGTLTDISTDPVDLKSLSIEWLTQTYYHMFKTKIENFIINLFPNTSSTEYKTAKHVLIGSMQNIINCFILRSDLPIHSNYKNNNYSLLGLVPETNSSIKKYKRTKEPLTVTNAIYSDSISSIWYQTQKGVIQLYNSLYNDTLLSSKYFNENLGNTMGLIFDYIQSQLVDDDNIYYSSDNLYPESLPDSMLASFVDVYKSTFSDVPILSIDEPPSDVVNKILDYVGEIYPAVDTKSTSSVSTNAGFNFFRMNIGDSSVTTSKAYKINTYVKDYYILYNYLSTTYETHKNLTLIKNDIDTLNYNTPTVGIRRKNTFQFEKSSVLTQYINNHIMTTYINPIIDKDVRDNMIILNNNTANYWNPGIYSGNTFIQKNPTGVYGILDAIYNQHFDGSISDTLSKISTIPIGLTLDSPVDFSQNPFTSYYLYFWYNSLNLSYSQLLTESEFTYRDLENITNLLMSKLYTLEGSTLIPAITTQSILQNKFISKLYTDVNKKHFPSVEYVAWFIYDLFVSDSNLNSFIKIEPWLQTIQKTTSSKFDITLFENKTTTINTTSDNGAIETLQQLILNFVKPIIQSNITNFQQISKFKSTADVETKNNINKFYNVDSNNNIDIFYYQQSLFGDPVLNVPLEIRLFNLISGIKPKYAWVKELGHCILKQVSLSIGGQTIDTYTPELNYLIAKLTRSVGHQRGYNILIGNTEEMYTYSNKKRDATKLIIPFNFFCCKNAGNSIPLISLLYSDVVISGQINDLSNLIYTEPDTIFKKIPKIKCGIMSRFIYVDDDERSLMAETKMEYLIEKFNYNGSKVFSQNNVFTTGANLMTRNITSLDLSNLTATAVIDITVNDPIKYFVWYLKFRDKTTELPIDIIDWCKFGYNVRNTDGQIVSIKNIIESIQITMNGITREMEHPESQYTHLIPYDKNMGSLDSGEYLYSFALYPLILQPTGCANYSQIPQSSIIMKFSKQIQNLFESNPNLEVKIELWGLAYNTLRYASGMAALLFNTP